MFTLDSHTEKNIDEWCLRSVLRRMFVYNKKVLKKDWTKLHREGIHTSYASADVTKIIKFSIVRSLGYIARIREIKSTHLWSKSTDIRQHLAESRVDERIALNWSLQQHDERMWNGLIWYGTGNSGTVVVAVLRLGATEREGIIK